MLLLAHLIDGRTDVLQHMKLVEDDLRVRVRHVRANGVPIRLPHVHRNGRNAIALRVAERREIARETGGFPVVSDVQNPWGIEVNDDTDVLMPFAITYAHRLVKKQSEVRKQGVLPWLRPDAKSQVTVVYEDGKPKSIDTVVLSTQHNPEIGHKELSEAVIEQIIKPVLPKELVKGNIKYLVNPTGAFEIGGPKGDCGLTGRKIIVDTYGGSAPHGGGAFSGKDPSKVDRSAAYAARYVAKNVVAAGLASKCLVQVSYAIGIARPTSVLVTTQGTGKISDEKLSELVQQHFDLRPKGIVQMLDLLRPIYEKTAAYGHFGRDEPEFTWENKDKALALKDAAGVK